ncbi:YhbY family RNA-binding protein [Candidatus Pacearchaeota archaeon]|nr:YhbY family RNA-binding protein [Candidatus Pacearchaeota archaeon]
MKKIGIVQLGKNGVTENFIETLKTYFKNHNSVRISVLKSGTRDREEFRKIAEEIPKKLGENFTSRTIGFTIIVRKWRKSMR